MIFPCPGLLADAPCFPPFVVLDAVVGIDFALTGAGTGVGSSSEKDSHEGSSFVTVIIRCGQVSQVPPTTVVRDQEAGNQKAQRPDTKRIRKRRVAYRDSPLRP